MCTGRPRSARRRATASCGEIVEHRPRPIRPFNPDIPDWLERDRREIDGKRPRAALLRCRRGGGPAPAVSRPCRTTASSFASGGDITAGETFCPRSPQEMEGSDGCGHDGFGGGVGAGAARSDGAAERQPALVEAGAKSGAGIRRQGRSQGRSVHPGGGLQDRVPRRRRRDRHGDDAGMGHLPDEDAAEHAIVRRRQCRRICRGCRGRGGRQLPQAEPRDRTEGRAGLVEEAGGIRQAGHEGHCRRRSGPEDRIQGSRPHDQSLRQVRKPMARRASFSTSTRPSETPPNSPAWTESSY